MAKFASFANNFLDAVLNNGASGTVVIGGTTYTLPMHVVPTSTLPTTTLRGSEWSGGNYATGGASIAGSFTTPAASQSKASTGAITVCSDAPATSWVAVEIADSSATPKPAYFVAMTGGTRTINIHDTVLLPAGNLAGTEA